MTLMERAKKIGVSDGYLWKVYHGYATPGKAVALKLEVATGKPRAWWAKAKINMIQKTIDAIEV